MKTELAQIKALKGIKSDVNLTLKVGKNKKSEFGEILFTEYGLSGPPVLQLSQMLQGNADNAQFSIDFMPEYDFENIVLMIKNNNQANMSVPKEYVFTGEYSYDGENWQDLYELEWNDYEGHTYNSQVACIKAFTVFDVINTTLRLDLDYITVNENSFNPVNITAYVLNHFGNPVNCGQVIFNLSSEIFSVNVSNGACIQFVRLCETWYAEERTLVR